MHLNERTAFLSFTHFTKCIYAKVAQKRPPLRKAITTRARPRRMRIPMALENPFAPSAIQLARTRTASCAEPKESAQLASTTKVFETRHEQSSPPAGHRRPNSVGVRLERGARIAPPIPFGPSVFGQRSVVAPCARSLGCSGSGNHSEGTQPGTPTAFLATTAPSHCRAQLLRAVAARSKTTWFENFESSNRDATSNR